ncbi:hypothetical protein BJY04DRAFT_218538 [Aspergillus karnatakaensis]|uniref:uncharacterized protein n=1 Tax=Aspergillus karnatakaensis TaxID=1810916 RepID=UPI003CCE31BE
MVLARGAQRFEPLVSSVFGNPNILGRFAAVKLEQEAASHEPSLRRFVGHHGVFRKCVTATEETPRESHTTSASPKRETQTKPRRSSKKESIRGQITSAMKSIIHRRSTPAAVSETNNLSHALSRVQAQDNTVFSKPSPRTSVRTFIGLIPFARLKQRSSGKSVG